ncbi:uncharacterized protein [Anabrus simplex]|uniref:uncharacterized protein n=1 Tax=Anabrus simplex TaxID=316456 RepID=UPI0035A299F7
MRVLRCVALACLLVSYVLLFSHGEEEKQEQIQQDVIFYDLHSNSSRGPLKQLLRRVPCSCQNRGCGCCTGMAVRSINFNRRACMNLTYEPYEFALVSSLFMDDDMVFTRNISGKNPPPFCIPSPIIYLPRMDLCVRFFNIFTPGSNLHLCMDIEARIDRAPVVVVHFDCLRMGFDGLALIKPEENGGLPPVTEPEESSGIPPVTEPGGEIQEDEGVSTTTGPNDEVYDPVAPGKEDSIKENVTLIS